MTEEESWQTDFFFPLRTVWPAQDQITNSYFWANTYKGDLTTPYTTAINNNSDAIFIQEGAIIGIIRQFQQMFITLTSHSSIHIPNYRSDRRLPDQQSDRCGKFTIVKQSRHFRVFKRWLSLLEWCGSNLFLDLRRRRLLQ